MKNKENIIHWLTLLSAKGVGPVTTATLIDTFGSIEALFKADRKTLLSVKGISPVAVDSLLSKKTNIEALEILDNTEKAGASVMTFTDEEYPSLLREIPDPPPVLFYRGNPSCLDSGTVAIVGSRKASVYGMDVAKKLASELASAGLSIVSGMATGIDTAAHKGALSEKGTTVAVLGTGIDIAYPQENKKLMEQISQSGIIVTEFPPKTKPEGRNFPKRNRIISGISMGTIVVEATEKSGSLITAHIALEQNRELFAVPGRITSSNSFGTNYLIKRGAKLVQRWQDVVEELLPFHEALSAQERSYREEEVKNLTLPEKLIIDKLSCEEQVHIDKLSVLTEMETPQLLTHLLSLELRGEVRQLPGKNFIKTFR